MAKPETEFVDLHDLLVNFNNESVLVLPLFDDDSPPKKSTGELDWKLGSFLSRKIKTASISLEKGACTLVTLPVATAYPLILCVACGDRTKMKTSELEKLFTLIASKVKLLGKKSALLPFATLSDIYSETELNTMLGKHFQELESRWIQ